jgi:outer membrane biosynthesis protein TonB
MSQQQDQPEELLVDLVIDSAGKVRSAEPAGKVKWVDAELINAASGWKFVPAFKDGRPVACRLRLTVSLKQ